MTTVDMLKKLSRDTDRDFPVVAQTFARQDMIRRIFASDHADRFALKGGSLVMLVEDLGPLGGRTTSDIDLALPAFEGNLEDLQHMLGEILVSDKDSQVFFDMSTYRVIARRADGDVGGGSVVVNAMVAGNKVKVKIDVTFDDRTRRDELVESDYPMVDGTSIRIRHVPLAHLAADKIQAMIRHGARCHRLRDHYDLWLMFRLGGIELEQVAAALPRSLSAFRIPLPEDIGEIMALSDDEAERRVDAWEHERLSRRFGAMTPSFPELNAYLRERVEMILDYARIPSPRM